MKAGTEPSPGAESEQPPKSSKVARWVVVIAALALAGVVGVIIYGYLIRPGWTGFADKTFWDYLDLLIVPVALALGLYWLSWSQSKREREAEEAQQQRERQAQAAQRERELEIENQRAQDEAVRLYLDQISHLLTNRDQPLWRARPGDHSSALARARTFTLLPGLDSGRKGSIVRFLYESGLIAKDTSSFLLNETDLTQVRLRKANLSEANLSGANLVRADLARANLAGARLEGANLDGANLGEANLGGANLGEANLHRASLHETYLQDLRGGS